jgi:hypothetical protein
MRYALAYTFPRFFTQRADAFRPDGAPDTLMPDDEPEQLRHRRSFHLMGISAGAGWY